MATNVKYEVKGNELIIRVNLDERHGPSESKKTVTIASTKGNVPLDDKKYGHVSFGLNVYTKDGLAAAVKKWEAEQAKNAAA